MLSFKCSPHQKLVSLVKEIIFLTSETNEHLGSDAFCTPTDYPSLVIHIGPPPFLIKHNLQTKLPDFFFTGLISDSNRLIPDKLLNTIVIKFQPTGLFHLFNVPMKQLCKMHYLDANSYFNFKTGCFLECLKTASGIEERKSIVDTFLLEKLAERIPDFDFVENCVEIISSSSGNISIERLVDISGVPVRTFRNRFIKKLGVPAKTYARIKRINRVLEFLSSSTNCKWQDIIYTSGYYDQPHFIRDFESMTGNSPSSFSELNIPYIFKISGK